MILCAFRTRMGWIALVGDDRVLHGVTLPRPARAQALLELRERFRCNPPLGENRLFRRARQKLIDYMAGKPVRFDDLPIDDSSGTRLQRKVWELTRAIPYGSTRTYRALACQVGRPKAARAIGQCMARNPLPLIIPCHRVVGTAGDLRGFGGGLRMKRTLLRMEGAL